MKIKVRSAIFVPAALLVAGVLGLSGEAQALHLNAAIGGVERIYGVDSCNGVGASGSSGTVSASVDCGPSASSAYATSGLVLGASAYSTYGWQSGGTATYIENFAFTAPGYTGPGTLLINFSINGSVSLTDSDNIFDAVGEFRAANSTFSDFTGIIELFGPATVPLLLHIVYGGPTTELIATLSAGTYGRNGDSVASSDFSHTAQIGSFEFRDAAGDLLSDVTVTAQGGVNPFVVATVPTVVEPPSLAIIGLGLSGLALVRRRRARA